MYLYHYQVLSDPPQVIENMICFGPLQKSCLCDFRTKPLIPIHRAGKGICDAHATYLILKLHINQALFSFSVCPSLFERP